MTGKGACKLSQIKVVELERHPIARDLGLPARYIYPIFFQVGDDLVSEVWIATREKPKSFAASPVRTLRIPRRQIWRITEPRVVEASDLRAEFLG
jgi:hypothetical protein